MQHRLTLHIGKVNAVEADFALELGIADLSICVGVLPRPQLGAVHAFLYLAVDPAGIHQRDLALVFFRLLVHQLKDALSAGHRHHDHVNLHADLANGVDKTARQGEEADDGTNRQGIHPGQPQVGPARDARSAADHRQQHVEQVAKVAHHGHHHITEFVCLGSGIAQVFIAGIKVGLGLCLAVEYLDHLLPLDHLLDIGVERAQCRLLLDKVAARVLDDDLEHQKQHDRKQHHKGGQPHTQVEHRKEGCHGRDERGKHLRDALGYRLAQRVGIVGIAAHDVPHRVGIKVANGQALHFGVHLVADVLERSLLDKYHGVVGGVVGDNAQRIDKRHGEDHPDQTCCDQAPACNCREDIIIDNDSQKQRCGCAHHR